MLNLDLAVRQRRWLLKSQREMAAELGVTERTFSRWENGHITPGVENLKRWAQALDVPVIKLLSDESAEAVGS